MFNSSFFLLPSRPLRPRRPPTDADCPKTGPREAARLPQLAPVNRWRLDQPDDRDEAGRGASAGLRAGHEGPRVARCLSAIPSSRPMRPRLRTHRPAAYAKVVVFSW